MRPCSRPNPLQASQAPANAEDLFPDAPEKALVVEHCGDCHYLDWIARSGGTEAGWRDRIERMIRGGATIPRDRVPAVAAYLAKAFPPRPIPDKPPRR